MINYLISYSLIFTLLNQISDISSRDLILQLDPVVLSSGYIVDRSTIMDKEGNLRFTRCPFSGKRLSNDVYPVDEKKRQIEYFRMKRDGNITQIARKLISQGSYDSFHDVLDAVEVYLKDLGENYLPLARELAAIWSGVRNPPSTMLLVDRLQIAGTNSWKVAVESGRLEERVYKILVSTELYEDQGRGSYKSSLALCLYDNEDEIVEKCILFEDSDYRRRESHCVFGKNDAIVKNARAGYTYKIEYLIGSSPRDVRLEGLMCKIFPASATTSSYRMRDGDGHEGLYIGSTNVERNADGEGSLEYDDGKRFVGKFRNGSMLDGVLYRGSHIRHTLKRGKWTQTIDDLLVEKYPSNMVVYDHEQEPRSSELRKGMDRLDEVYDNHSREDHSNVQRRYETSERTNPYERRDRQRASEYHRSYTNLGSTTSHLRSRYSDDLTMSRQNRFGKHGSFDDTDVPYNMKNRRNLADEDNSSFREEIDLSMSRHSRSVDRPSYPDSRRYRSRSADIEEDRSHTSRKDVSDRSDADGIFPDMRRRGGSVHDDNSISHRSRASRVRYETIEEDGAGPYSREYQRRSREHHSYDFGDDRYNPNKHSHHSRDDVSYSSRTRRPTAPSDPVVPIDPVEELDHRRLQDRPMDDRSSRYNRDDRSYHDHNEPPNYDRDNRSRRGDDEPSKYDRDDRSRRGDDEPSKYDRDDRSRHSNGDRSRHSRTDNSRVGVDPLSSVVPSSMSAREAKYLDELMTELETKSQVSHHSRRSGRSDRRDLPSDPPPVEVPTRLRDRDPLNHDDSISILSNPLRTDSPQRHNSPQRPQNHGRKSSSLGIVREERDAVRDTDDKRVVRDTQPIQSKHGRPFMLHVTKLQRNLSKGGVWIGATQTGYLEDSVKCLMISVSEFLDKNKKTNLGIALYDETGQFVARCNIFGNRTKSKGNFRLITDEEKIVSKAKPGYFYQLQYAVNTGSQDSLQVKGWICKIFPTTKSSTSFPMEDKDGDKGFYYGPVDRKRQAHGNGYLEYENGCTFVGKFAKGLMLTGAYYKVDQLQATFSDMKWTDKIDRDLADEYPSNIQVFKREVRKTDIVYSNSEEDRIDGLSCGC
jgi:hypothetical protein